MPLDLSQLNLTPSKPTDNLIGSFEAPIPGESLTGKPKALPYEQPPQYADPEDALDHIFKRLMQPRQAAQMLGFLEAGVPVATLVEILCTGGVQEGLWPQTTVFLLAPPVTVMLIRMAQAAGVDFKMNSEEGKPEQAPEILVKLARARISSGDLDKAIRTGEQSKSEIKKDHLKMGLMSPKGFV